MNYLNKYKKEISCFMLLISILLVLIINIFLNNIWLKLTLSVFFSGLILIYCIFLKKGILYFVKYLTHLIVFTIGVSVGCYINMNYINPDGFLIEEYLKGPTIATILIVLNLKWGERVKNLFQKKFKIVDEETIKKQSKKEFNLISNSHSKYYKLYNKFSFQAASSFEKNLRLIIGIFLFIIGSSILFSLNYTDTIFEPSFYPALVIMGLFLVLLSYIVIDWGLIISIVSAIIITAIILVLYKIYLIDIIYMFLVLITIIIFLMIPFRILLYNYYKKSSRFFSGYEVKNTLFGVDLYYKNFINNKFHDHFLIFNFKKTDSFIQNINESIAFIANRVYRYKMFFVGFKIDDDINLYFYTSNYIKPFRMKKYLSNYNKLVTVTTAKDLGFKYYLEYLYPDLYNFYHIKNADLYYGLIMDKYDFERDATMMFTLSFQKEDDFFSFVEKTDELGYSILPFNELFLEQYDWGIKLVVYLSTKLGLDKLNNNTDKIIKTMELYHGELLTAYINYNSE